MRSVKIPIMYSRLGIALILVLCSALRAQAAVNCTVTGSGRFADPDDRTCQRYTLCVYDSSTSSFRAYNYVCPTTSVFNPNTSKCTASGNYMCNANNSNSTNSTSVCTSEGIIADPSSTNCSSYIMCVNIDGGFVSTTFSCPAGTFFEPSTTLCKSDYVCTFVCKANGRFANTADNACKSYYLCVRFSDNTYGRYLYTCPGTSVFNPNSKMCTTSYMCPTSA